MSDMISREAAAAICDEAACETRSDSARHELFRARDAIRAIPAVQPDAAAIREAALREAADAIDPAIFDHPSVFMGGPSRQAKRSAEMVQKIIRALIDNPGKEVMPVVPQGPTNPHDTAPAGLSAGGSAPPAWPEGLFHLTGDTLHLRCATEGCEQRVSTRFEGGGIGSDYCEPCGRKVATKGGA